MIPIILVFGLLYYLIWGLNLSVNPLEGFNFENTLFNKAIGVILFLVLVVLGIVLHELIHGITFARFAKNGFQSIKFGILKEMLTPYCHCKEPLKVSQYIIGALMPAIILGFIPSILAIISGNFWLLLFGIFFTMSAIGDFMIVHLIRKENKDSLVQDHPSEAGCFIYREIKTS